MVKTVFTIVRPADLARGNQELFLLLIQLACEVDEAVNAEEGYAVSEKRLQLSLFESSMYHTRFGMPVDIRCVVSASDRAEYGFGKFEVTALLYAKEGNALFTHCGNETPYEGPAKEVIARLAAALAKAICAGSKCT